MRIKSYSYKTPHLLSSPATILIIALTASFSSSVMLAKAHESNQAPVRQQQVQSPKTSNLSQRSEPESPMALIKAAQQLAERGEQLDLALEYVRRATAIPPVPNDAVPRSSFFLVLAYVQIKRGEFNQAIDTLTNGVQSAPEYARLDQYLNYLALAYEKAGRIDDAIETYITLAGGTREVISRPSEQLVALYRQRFGSLDGLQEKIEDNHRKARRKFYVDNQVLSLPAPWWMLPDLNGLDVSMSDFAGKVTVMSFLYTGFQTDNEENALKFMQELYEKYRDKGVAFICVDETNATKRETIKEGLQRRGISLPTVIDSNAEIARRYGTYDSLIVLIDEHGRIRFKNTLWHDYRPFVKEQIEFLVQSRTR